MVCQFLDECWVIVGDAGPELSRHWWRFVPYIILALSLKKGLYPVFLEEMHVNNITGMTVFFLPRFSTWPLSRAGFILRICINAVLYFALQSQNVLPVYL